MTPRTSAVMSQRDRDLTIIMLGLGRVKPNHLNSPGVSARLENGPTRSATGEAQC